MTTATPQMPSKTITSNQSGPHERLLEFVRKHGASTYRKPMQAHNLQAFERIQNFIVRHQPDALILDSCCGTGMSTVSLAGQYPEYAVFGIDRSRVRINKGEPLPDNCLLLQANCEDIWRLCIAHRLHFQQHFILYPNPYPKAEHLKRRWHGHPCFPVLLQLAELTCLRSNWRLYLEEFKLAWQALGGKASGISELRPDTSMTLFEKKYAQSGHRLFELLTRPSC